MRKFYYSETCSRFLRADDNAILGEMGALTPAGGCIELHLDSPDGPLAGTLRCKPGHGWKQQSARLSGAKGVHDLYFVFTEGGFEWEWWQMK